MGKAAPLSWICRQLEAIRTSLSTQWDIQMLLTPFGGRHWTSAGTCPSSHSALAAEWGCESASFDCLSLDLVLLTSCLSWLKEWPHAWTDLFSHLHIFMFWTISVVFFSAVQVKRSTRANFFHLTSASEGLKLLGRSYSIVLLFCHSVVPWFCAP